MVKSKPRLLNIVARVSEDMACAVFRQLCVIEGYPRDIMMRGMIYLVPSLSGGTVNGIDVRANNAPARHAFGGGRVVGFLPADLDAQIDFGGSTGFYARIERKGAVFEIQLEVTEQLAEQPLGVTLRRLMGNQNGSQETWTST